MARLALTLAYDGSRFAGSQLQPGARTVQGEIERALSDFYGTTERTVFAGRTDRGVHAAGQVVGCEDHRPDLPPRAIREALNARLPDDVAVVEVGRRPDAFHARYDARWREYRYRIWCGARQPLARHQVWVRADGLDIDAMAGAAERIIGEHDFASLAGGGEGVPWSERQGRPRGTVRRVFGCRCLEASPWWTEPGHGRLVEVRVTADGFLPQMVRTLVASLVAVGRGAKPAEWIEELLAARDRRLAPATAPAQGLTFWRVGYGADLPAGTGGDVGEVSVTGEAGR